jgi:D-proline reductase (dithiol) PrdB
MPRLDRLPEVQRNNLLTQPVPEFDSAPCTPLPKPLSECTLAIVTTAGIHRRDDKPFTGGDQTYRVIPSSSAQADILQSHASIGFDRSATYRDLNVVFPLDRVRELVERGALAALAPNFYSFMGAQRDTTRIQEETGPEVGRRLAEAGVDVVLITPT